MHCLRRLGGYGLMALVSLLLSSISLRAAEPPSAAEVARPGTGGAIDVFFERLAAHGFSDTVLVASHGEILLEKGYGLADRETGTPVRTDTIFQIASLDKQFIAAAVLRLEMEGRLHVEDSLSQYLPALATRHGVALASFPRGAAALGPITLSQLMSHTSGLNNIYFDQAGSWKSFLEQILQAPLEAAPGARYEYSNTGYDLLSGIVEIASGTSLASFLESRFERPLGMTDTGDTRRAWPVGRLARYQDPETRSFLFPVALPTERPERYREGEILSTVGDLYRWSLALSGDRVLSAEARAKLFTAVRDGYAYGWNVVSTDRGRLAFHGGYDTAFGVCTGIYRWLDEDAVFIVLANTIENRRLSHEYLASTVGSLLFGGDVPLPPAGVSQPASDLARLSGRYRLATGGEIDVRADRAGRLTVKSKDPQAILLLTFPDASATGRSPWGDESRLAPILDGLEHGDPKPLQSTLAPDINGEVYGLRILAGWAEMKTHLGALRDHRSVYQMWYDYEGHPEVQNYVLLRFDRGSQVLRVLRDLDGHLSFDLVRLPEQLEMTMASPSEKTPRTFLGWNPKLGMGPRLDFETDATGAITRLVIRGREGKETAERMAEPQLTPQEKSRA
jgi:CubicO group peptidase (beta-lactamase class C family)